ncbi:hypothetical protein GOODEAATRI_017316 [Goodea atripinnis]|uniref:Uncharacterized protein n=1 Tax=Goodea atripinnis TaxID=208336 RepID=A0ABV0PEU3_9TELE
MTSFRAYSRFSSNIISIQILYIFVFSSILLLPPYCSPSPSLTTVSAINHFWFLGTTFSPRPEMVLTHRHRLEEGPGETVLPAATQEVEPSTEGPGHLQHCHYSVCPVFILHCVVWLIRKTGQV